MRVAVISYPALFQRTGGLQIQVRETIRALQDLGIDIRYVNLEQDQIRDFDLLHIFSAYHGMHRVAEFAFQIGVPVVTSPLVRVRSNTTAAVSRIVNKILGRLTHWTDRSEHAHISSCLDHSARVIALGKKEQECLVKAFRVPADRIDTIPNGIPARFFQNGANQTCGDAITKRHVLVVATICRHKNQLTLIEALHGTGIPVVLIGPTGTGEEGYLEQCLQHDNVSYLGAIDYASSDLVAAYCCAGVFCLASESEVMPLSMLEALAAGTPAVCTNRHGMDLSPMADVVIEVDPHDKAAIRTAVERHLRAPPSAQKCEQAVRHLTWEAVAHAVLQTYERALAQQAPADAVRRD